MKKIILAVAVAAVASMAFIVSASAWRERYQINDMTVQPEGAVRPLAQRLDAHLQLHV